jgi:hypothetical protein
MQGTETGSPSTTCVISPIPPQDEQIGGGGSLWSLIMQEA